MILERASSIKNWICIDCIVNKAQIFLRPSFSDNSPPPATPAARNNSKADGKTSAGGTGR